MSMDLDKDYSVNGHVFAAGKGVDTTYMDTDADGKAVKVDGAEAIKQMQQTEKESSEYGGHTHGVPTMDDPLEPTSGTPTRPDGNDSGAKVTGDPIPKEEK